MSLQGTPRLCPNTKHLPVYQPNFCSRLKGHHTQFWTRQSTCVERTDVVQWTRNNALCVLSYISLSTMQKYGVLYSNGFMTTSYRRKQYTVLRASCKTPKIFVPLLSNSDFFGRTSCTYRNIKFHGNPSSWSSADTFGQTNGHDEANSRFSELGERALKQIYWWHMDVSSESCADNKASNC